jgi:hypothetical protein
MFLISAANDSEPALTYATFIWLGAVVAYVVHSIGNRRERKRAQKSRRLKWIAGFALLAAPLLGIADSTCPHQRVIRIGSLQFRWVTDPRGPCNNGRQFHPLIFSIFH